MNQPLGHHLAEFNLGVLKHDWDDPRVADFADNIDRVNAIAQRAPGFVWMLDGDGMEAAQLDPGGPLGDNPRTASILSVWKDVASLEHFVWNTVHKKFYGRRAEWYHRGEALRLVLWWVPEGHHPDVAEAMGRFQYLEANGESDHAFGWTHLKGG